MTRPTLSLVLACVVLTAAAQLLLKAGTMRLGEVPLRVTEALPLAMRILAQPQILAGVACYFASMLLWILALSRLDVSVAYPMLSLGYVLAPVAAHFIFGESLSPQRVAGIGLIVLGVFVVSTS